jgi:hypothetical protein
MRRAFSCDGQPKETESLLIGELGRLGFGL